MSIITTFFNYFMFFFIGLAAVSIFIRTSKEFWDEMGKDAAHDIMVRTRELTVKTLDGTVSLLGTMRMRIWKLRNRLSRQI